MEHLLAPLVLAAVLLGWPWHGRCTSLGSGSSCCRPLSVRSLAPRYPAHHVVGRPAVCLMLRGGKTRSATGHLYSPRPQLSGCSRPAPQARRVCSGVGGAPVAATVLELQLFARGAPCRPGHSASCQPRIAYPGRALTHDARASYRAAGSAVGMSAASSVLSRLCSVQQRTGAQRAAGMHAGPAAPERGTRRRKKGQQLAAAGLRYLAGRCAPVVWCAAVAVGVRRRRCCVPTRRLPSSPWPRGRRNCSRLRRPRISLRRCSRSRLRSVRPVPPHPHHYVRVCA